MDRSYNLLEFVIDSTHVWCHCMGQTRPLNGIWLYLDKIWGTLFVILIKSKRGLATNAQISFYKKKCISISISISVFVNIFH